MTHLQIIVPGDSNFDTNKTNSACNLKFETFSEGAEADSLALV